MTQERKKKLRRTLIIGLSVIGLLVVAGLIYYFFLAPPFEIRQAIRHERRGEYLARDEGDLEAALAEFEAANAFDPANPGYLVWIGVLRSELGDTDAGEEAFASARALYETDAIFLSKRTEVYRDVGNLEAAITDIDQAIAENPDWGWLYYTRHTVNLELGDYWAAFEDLETADELAQEAGDAQLEAMSRMQKAMVMQMLSLSEDEGTPTPQEGEDGTE